MEKRSELHCFKIIESFYYKKWTW